jgi:hypothetical protein
MCPGWQRCTEEGTQVQEWPKARGGQHLLHKTRIEVRNRSLAPATPATPSKVGICFHFMLLRPQSSARKHAKFTSLLSLCVAEGKARRELADSEWERTEST